MTTRRALLASSAGVLATPFLPVGGAFAQSPPGVVVIAKQIDDMISVDPAESFEFSGNEVCGACYDKLVANDPEEPTRIVGDLAESWKASEDGRTFTFTLRDGLKFASGNPVTAEDAAFSLQRVVALNKSPAFIINQFGFTKANMAEAIHAADARTLVLRTAEPASLSFLLYCLSANVGAIVDSKVVKAHAAKAADGTDDMGYGWLKQNTAGSGSFVLRAWRPSDSVTLEANPNAREAPKTKRVVIRHIADPSAQMLGLQQGDYDVVRNLGSDQLRSIEGDNRYRMIRQRRATVIYLSLNQKHPILSKPQVRQAIKWAIDYAGIQKNIVPMTYAVHQAFLPEGFPGALTAHPFQADVNKAKALLAEAGHPDGFEVSFDYFSSAPYADIAQAVQANLAAIGIRARMLPSEQRQVITKTRARTHEIAMVYWGSDYFDPNSNSEAFSVNTDNGEEARNRTLAWRAAWYIPELSKRSEEALRETDAAKRAALYEALQRDHQEQSPLVVMLQSIEVAVTRASVSGMRLGVVSDQTSFAGIVKS
ncbi:ABC transporter substrate-binding protein [Roseomonas elaeocarpi]|uniref:ABC transporter substrate-binding protein n=1 Tax=Roseomonas elaeocarpi TaxID=907779 RepID=A0ABV6JNJ9_9PROT